MAVAFSGGAALRAGEQQRRLVRRVVAALGSRMGLVSVDPADPFGLEEVGVARSLAWREALRAVHAQGVVVGRARALVCEYGPLAHLGPLLGVPTVALLGEPAAVVGPDFDIGYRAARALGTPLVVLEAGVADVAATVAAGTALTR